MSQVFACQVMLFAELMTVGSGFGVRFQGTRHSVQISGLRSSGGCGPPLPLPQGDEVQGRRFGVSRVGAGGWS